MSVYSLFAQMQTDPNQLPWYGWLLIVLGIAFVVWTSLRKQPVVEEPELKLDEPVLDELPEGVEETCAESEKFVTELIEGSRITEAKGRELIEDAEDLLAGGDVSERVEVIEHDLDGIEGPEVVKIVHTTFVEKEGVQVTKKVEHITSVADGDLVQEVYETLEVDTDGVEVTRVSESVSSLSSDVVEEAETLFVDGEGVDVVNRVETAYDAMEGVGVVDATRTIIDDETGEGLVDKMQGLITDAEEDLEDLGD